MYIQANDDDTLDTFDTWEAFSSIPFFSVMDGELQSLEAVYNKLNKPCLESYFTSFLKKVFKEEMIVYCPGSGDSMVRAVCLKNVTENDIERVFNQFRLDNDWSRAIIFLDKVKFVINPSTNEITHLEIHCYFFNRELKMIRPLVERLERIKLINDFLLEN